jgi:hypothetical protein
LSLFTAALADARLASRVAALCFVFSASVELPDPVAGDGVVAAGVVFVVVGADVLGVVAAGVVFVVVGADVLGAVAAGVVFVVVGADVLGAVAAALPGVSAAVATGAT